MDISLFMGGLNACKDGLGLFFPATMVILRIFSKCPQSARLSLGGGSLIVFGQCPKAEDINEYGSSLTIQCTNHSLHKDLHEWSSFGSLWFEAHNVSNKNSNHRIKWNRFPFPLLWSFKIQTWASWHICWQSLPSAGNKHLLTTGNKQRLPATDLEILQLWTWNPPNPGPGALNPLTFFFGKLQSQIERKS